MPKPKPQIGAAPSGVAPAYLCPPALLLRARRLGPAPVAIASANADHVLECAGWAREFGLIEPILVGDVSWIERHVQDHEPSLAHVRVVPAASEAEAAQIAVGLVRGGEAKMLMKGHLHTDVLMRAVLDADTGLRTDRRLSHVFAMIWPGSSGYLLITDAALNVAPDQKTMLHIVRHAIAVAQALDMIHPRIAMLSATEEVNPAMPSSVAAASFRQSFLDEAKASGCFISGPLALDVALSAHAARLKGLHGDPVAGQADILVVPNIETGNALFKMLVHLRHATAIGVVLGAAAPIVLTSRADPAEAKLASIALARIMTTMA
jgi:phosphate acetyltransferase